MKAVVSLDEFRKNLSDIIAGVMYGNQSVLVQRHSKAGVVVISEKEYQSLKDPRQRFASQQDWDKLFVLTDKVRDAMPKNNQRRLESVVSKEIKALHE